MKKSLMQLDVLSVYHRLFVESIVYHSYKSKGSVIQAYYSTREAFYQISEMNMPIGIKNATGKKFDDWIFHIPEEYGGQKAAAGKDDKKADPKKDKGKAAKEEFLENEEEDRLMEAEDIRIWTEVSLEKGKN